MKKLVYINVLMRDDSRTRQLSDFALNNLKGKYEIQEINLTHSSLKPLDHDSYLNRQNNGEKDPLILNYANAIKNADAILIATPFWDMSFPSILKVFFERVSLFGITFTALENGDCVGMCKGAKVLYITSRGMNIEDKSELDSGYHYINAIGHLFGLGPIFEVSVNKIDMVGTDITKTYDQAKEKLKLVLENF